LSQHSVLDSSIIIKQSGGDKFVKKTIRLNTNLEKHTKEIFSFIGKYIDKLQSADIPLPKIIDSNFTHGQLTYICEYGGENILGMVKRGQLENTINCTTIFNQIMGIIKKAQKTNTYFDPHPKNFVILNDKLSYVDFTPPWLEEYFDLRLSKAKGNEVKILEDFFSCMHFKELGFHLVGDLLKIDNNNYKNLSLLYQRLIKRGLIGKGYDEFIKKAKSIMKKEKRREKKNIYLL
jgi:hypothetical protein